MSLRIFSLRRPADAVAHAHSQCVRAPISYLPQGFWRAPLRVARGQVHVWRHFHRPWRHALRKSLRHARADGDGSSLISFFHACCIAQELQGIRHLHAHYASIPAKLCLLVQRLTNISFSVTTHAKDLFYNDPFASPKLRERLCRARFVIANSRFSAQYIRSRLEGQGEIHTVYNGIDLQAFPARNGEPGEPVILSVGRLVEKKGFTHLISACRILKQRGIRFICELAGTGPLGAAIKEQVRGCGLGDQIRLLGPLPQEVLRRHYDRALVFALPCVAASDGDRDIVPNVLKEAMAIGVPVVTTRLEGIEELVEDDASGLLVAPGDAVALAAKLELLLRDRALRQRLAGEGRKVIEQRFDRRANFAQLKALLIEAIRTPAGVEARQTLVEPLSLHANRVH
jgi:glycosyltransferase involved in cell wall biosynthesis